MATVHKWSNKKLNFALSKYYHCNMHFKIGHGHKESLNEEACVVFPPTTMKMPVGKKNNTKMNNFVYLKI